MLDNLTPQQFGAIDNEFQCPEVEISFGTNATSSTPVGAIATTWPAISEVITDPTSTYTLFPLASFTGSLTTGVASSATTQTGASKTSNGASKTSTGTAASKTASRASGGASISMFGTLVLAGIVVFGLVL